MISLVAGTLSVFFAVLLQRTIGTLYEARSIKIWLSNAASFPSVDELRQLRDAYQEMLRLGNSDMGTQLKLEIDTRFSAVAGDQEKQAVASLLSALVLDMPWSLIYLALGSFLTGLAVYSGLDSQPGYRCWFWRISRCFHRCHYCSVLLYCDVLPTSCSKGK